MADNKLKFVRAKIPTRHRVMEDVVYVLLDSLDEDQFDKLTDRRYGYGAHKGKLPDGTKVVQFTFGNPKAPNQKLIIDQWNRIVNAMQEFNGELFDQNGTKLNVSFDENGLPSFTQNKESDTNVNDVETILDEISDLEDDLDYTELNATDVKEKLTKFKQDLMNCLTSEEFKKLMNPIIKKKMSLGHKFSLKNTILIMLQDPKATYVKSKSAWQSWGRFVKPDAPAIWLYVPRGRGNIAFEEKEGIIKYYLNKYKVKGVDDLPPGAKEELKVSLRGYSGSNFKLTPSFYDIRFTSPMKGRKDDFINTIEANKEEEVPWYDGTSEETSQTKKLFNIILNVVKEHGITVNYVDNLGGARGVSKSGVIDLLKNEPINAGYLNTLTHEFSHELLHQSYLKSRNKDLIDYFVGTKQGRKVVEQQAELCAWIVLRNYGFDMQTNINYIGMWGINEDTAMIVFDSVSNTASYIVDKINNEINKYKLTESRMIKETFLPSGEELADMFGYGEMYDAAKYNQETEIDNNIDYNEENNINNQEMNMESKQIKLSESEFKEFITEAVNNVLNEISRELAQATYDKMIHKGQNSRADDLDMTFREINNDDNAKYSLAGNSLTLVGDKGEENGDLDYRKATKYTYRNDSPSEIDVYAHKRLYDKYGNYVNDAQRIGGHNTKHRITTNPKVARNMARHMKNFNPDTKMTKDDFRY